MQKEEIPGEILVTDEGLPSEELYQEVTEPSGVLVQFSDSTHI